MPVEPDNLRGRKALRPYNNIGKAFKSSGEATTV